MRLLQRPRECNWTTAGVGPMLEAKTWLETAMDGDASRGPGVRCRFTISKTWSLTENSCPQAGVFHTPPDATGSVSQRSFRLLLVPNLVKLHRCRAPALHDKCEGDQAA
ncbi:unnamed protein product [Symbiodinium sp. CCMP2592]|nr:unnamed protein product [Symbiodinium sp. CCMP2592]